MAHQRYDLYRNQAKNSVFDGGLYVWRTSHETRVSGEGKPI